MSAAAARAEADYAEAVAVAATRRAAAYAEAITMTFDAPSELWVAAGMAAEAARTAVADARAARQLAEEAVA